MAVKGGRHPFRSLARRENRRSGSLHCRIGTQDGQHGTPLQHRRHRGCEGRRQADGDVDQEGEGQNLMLNPAARTVACEIRKLPISCILQISYSALSAWIASNLLIYLVRMKGLEPSLPCEN